MSTVYIELPLSLNLFHFANATKRKEISGLSIFPSDVNLKLSLTKDMSAFFHMDNVYYDFDTEILCISTQRRNDLRERFDIDDIDSVLSDMVDNGWEVSIIEENMRLLKESVTRDKLE